MSKNRDLKEYEEQIQACVKCGACQAHCPAYLEKRMEGAVARGKIALAAALLNNEADLEERLRQEMSMCLMCGSCVNKCPNQVPTDKIVGAIRREITDNRGMSPVAKGVSTLIGSPSLMKNAAKGGALFSSLVCKKVPKSSGLRLRFSPSSMKDRTLPNLTFKNLFELYPEFIQGNPEKETIAFFSGCSLTYVYPEIGGVMIRLLQNMGYSVFMPHTQRCCGIPALSLGNGRLVEELADDNLAAFTKREVAHIITACGSCNGGISDYATMKGEYGQVSKKVIDFSVFLQQEGFVEELERMPKWRKRIKVTYHDPCHLKTQGITLEPRAILCALPNVEFVEMENAASCCGLGGTFSVHHYATSKAIGSRKIPGLKESGATKIATACPGCMMQLQDTINHASLKVEAVHILNLMEEALAGPERSGTTAIS